MALKDWKKVGDDYFHIMKQKHNNERLRIGKGIDKLKSIWFVDLMWDIKYGVTQGHFKTKSEAIKFAKSYMRTH